MFLLRQSSTSGHDSIRMTRSIRSVLLVVDLVVLIFFRKEKTMKKRHVASWAPFPIEVHTLLTQMRGKGKKDRVHDLQQTKRKSFETEKEPTTIMFILSFSSLEFYCQEENHVFNDVNKPRDTDISLFYFCLLFLLKILWEHQSIWQECWYTLYSWIDMHVNITFRIQVYIIRKQVMLIRKCWSLCLFDQRD